MNICRTNIICKMLSNKGETDLVIPIKLYCLDEKILDFELNQLSMI